MHMLIPLSAVGLTLLLCVLPAECAFNWDHLGGPPPESEEPIAYQTVPTKEPTPRYLKRIKEFLKRNRPRHAVEMLFPDNATALAEQHKEIKANMTKDPTWALRKLEELQREKGTSVCLIPDDLKNFTFPDMGIGTYDGSKTDEKLNDYIDNCHLETDYEKLKAKYDPHDVWYNKSINWGEPTYDDEEFDKFVQKRIGRLLLGVYELVHSVDEDTKRVGVYEIVQPFGDDKTGGTKQIQSGISEQKKTPSGISEIIPKKTIHLETKVTDIIKTINAITRDILKAAMLRNLKLQSKLDTTNINKLYYHYFLHNVLIETKTLKKRHLISSSFEHLIKLIVKQFKHLNLNELENVLENLAKNYESVFEIINLLLANQGENRETDNHMATSVEALFKNVLNPLVSSDTKDNGIRDEVNVGQLEHLLKPIVEAYDHSVEINVKQKGDSAQDNKLAESLNKRQELPSNEELTTRISHVNQINNIINIYINNPNKHHKRRRSIVMETTTYLPPWDPKKEMFPKLEVPGFSEEEPFNPLSFSFYKKRRDAWEQHMKNKLGKPNNNSQSSFIFETWEYDNPNKTRRSHAARLQNIAKIKEQGQIKKEMRKGNKTYEAEWAARRDANMARQRNQTQQKQYGQHNKHADKDKHSHNHHHKEHKHKDEKKPLEDKSELAKEEKKDVKKPEDKETTTVFNIQGITNLDCWFDEAEKYYSKVFKEEQDNNKNLKKVTTVKTMTTRGKESRSKESIDSSYERYKRRKERRRKHKMSRRRYSSSEEQSRSSSCEHCNKRRRRKQRRYSSSEESDYTESESSRRDKRRKRKYRYSSDSSDASRRRRYRSSESKDASISVSKANKKHKHKRSNEEITTPRPTTTTNPTTWKSTTTKRKITQKVDDAVEALDEPSAIISDVPSHELTSWHYWKEWSLFYFMHPNISDYNFTTVNKWKTTYPWTTRKVRITKWRHPNVSWPPMSDSDSRSSQDSYDWGSGQSWIQNQKRELKSVEHFMRDNLFSEVNEGMDQLDKLDIQYSGNSADQDMELSENEDKVADFSDRYKGEYRRYKAEEKEREREYQKWSLSGGNYSTTTEYQWEIKVTKNFSNLRSFRKGGHDIVFDISGLTLDPMSIEQIEKNMDADYLWKYGKNRTKTTTLPTTTSTTQPTTSTTTTTTTETLTIGTSASNTPSTSVTDTPQADDQETPWFEEGKSMINSQFDQMTSVDREQHLKEFENNLDKYDPVGHHIFDNPQDQQQRKKRDIEGNANVKKQAETNAANMKKETLIKQILENRISLDDLYVQNKKEKMHFLHEVPQLSAAQIRQKELLLESELDKCLQDHQNQQKEVRNSGKARRFRRGIGKRPKRAAPAEPVKNDEGPLDLNDFNQGKNPNDPIFLLSDEDLENGKYKSYNATFINDKIHEEMDNMIDELKINHDTSEEEKHANSIYYRKYVEKRTTEFFQKLRQVLEGDNKRAIQDFTYPPNYDFDAASVRDPKKEPYLAQLKEEYRKEHTKSFEELERDIALAKQGKYCTRQLRKEAEEHVRNLPDDEF